MSDLLSRARDAEDLDCPRRDLGPICQGELIRELADEIERLRLAISAASNVASSYVSVDGRLLHDVVVEMGSKLEAAEAEIERLKAYTAAYNTLLAERVEIECLRGLAIRAWHSFRSGLTATGGCRDGLTDGDILELVRLSNVEAAKNRERDVLHDCRQGKQRCHECPDVACADNMSDAAEVTRLRAENADLRQQLIDAGVWDE